MLLNSTFSKFAKLSYGGLSAQEDESTDFGGIHLCGMSYVANQITGGGGGDHKLTENFSDLGQALCVQFFDVRHGRDEKIFDRISS